jgi:hypothetical protein
MTRMNRTKSFAILAILSTVVLATPIAFAWQSYAVSGDGPVFIQSPGKAALYRRTLVGEPQAFQFDIVGAPSRVRFQLFVPNEEQSKGDVSAALVNRDNPGTPVVTLDPSGAPWAERFYDSKAGLQFLAGPKTEQQLEAGQYEIRIWSSNNDSAYALGMGDLAGEVAAEQRGEEPRAGEAKEVNPNLRTVVIIGTIAAVCAGIWFARRKPA